MVSMMDVEPKKGPFCDRSRPKVTPSSADSDLAKKAFKLSLKSTSVEDATAFVPKQLSKDSGGADMRSPLSPNSGTFQTHDPTTTTTSLWAAVKRPFLPNQFIR